MSDKKTKYPATYVVFWPGQEVYVCARHMAQLRELAKVMGGAPLSARLLEDIGEAGECVNCMNEARSK